MQSTPHIVIDELVVVLSDCVEQDLPSKVRASPFVGILCDESTDSANIKQFVVLVRYVFKGKPYTSFLRTNGRHRGWQSLYYCTVSIVSP